MDSAIFGQIRQMPVIDSHEHLLHERDMRTKETDVVDFMTPYVCDVLMSCGMSEEEWKQVNDKSVPFQKRYSVLERYLPHIRFTTYYKSMMRGLSLCYGMKDLSLGECERVNDVLKAGVDTEPLFVRHNIRKALTFVGYAGVDYFSDSRVMIPVPTVSYITPKCEEELKLLEESVGFSVNDLTSLERAIRSLFDLYRRCGLKNIKIGSAYNRTLDYALPDTDKAERQLRSVVRGEFSAGFLYGQNNMNIPLDGLKDLDNFVVWKCAELAAEQGMNVIFHTGLHAWNRNDPQACHANYLQNFIRSHADQKIVLLHAGYPYTDDALLLCRYYPNVYLDLAWLHILDRREAVRTVERAIELLPVNKIVGFGGDVCTPVNTVGNLSVSLENLAHAFAGLVRCGDMTESEAVETCRRWLYDNPKEIYGVNA